MTRHRRDDDDGLDGDAPWRARDYGRAARPPDAPGDSPAPGDGPAGAPRPARGALGTSSGRDDRPGEETDRPGSAPPPWEQPGWDEATACPAQAARRQRAPVGPAAAGVLRAAAPPVIRGVAAGGLRAAAAGSGGGLAARRAWLHRTRGPSQEDASYLRTGYPDPGYAGADARHRGDGDADYAERSLPGTGFASGEHPSQRRRRGRFRLSRAGPGLRRHRLPRQLPVARRPLARRLRARVPGRARLLRGGYSAGSGYPDEPGYPAEGYRDEGDYPGGDYPAEPGYAPEDYDRDDYPGADPATRASLATGAAHEPGYPGGPDEPAIPARTTPAIRPLTTTRPAMTRHNPRATGTASRYRDDPDDHGYGDAGGWYDEGRGPGRAWGDDEYDSGVLPGFSERHRSPARRRAAAPAASRARPGRGGPDRPRGGKPKRKSAMRRAARVDRAHRPGDHPRRRRRRFLPTSGTTTCTRRTTRARARALSGSRSRPARPPLRSASNWSTWAWSPASGPSPTRPRRAATAARWSRATTCCTSTCPPRWRSRCC